MTRDKYKQNCRISACSAAILLALPFAGTAYAATAGTPATSKAAVVRSTAGSPCGRVEIAPMVTIPVGKSSVIRPQVPVTRILLGNPENVQAAKPSADQQPDDKSGGQGRQANTRPGVGQVDVLLLSPNEIYLLGKAVGATNVVMVDRAGGCTALDITVAMDVSSVQNALATFLPDESNIKVSSAYDSLVLTGMVKDATRVDRAVEIAAAYVREGNRGGNTRVVNMLQVGAPQQVMLEVKVAEISKTVLDRFGINFSRAYALADGSAVRFLSGILGGQGVIAGSVSNILAEVDASASTTAGGTTATTSGTAVVPGFGTVDLTGSGSATNGSLTSAIRGGAMGKSATSLSVDALKQDGLVKVLAEPTVMAISGQEGSFLAGGRILIPVREDDGGFTLEEKEFGVSLKFKPTVLADNRINLNVTPEVSELSATGVTLTSTVSGGTTILPAFTTRKAATTVQLQDGQSFAIGGLIKNNVTGNVDAFPILGELPIIGALFRSTSFQTDRSELVFVITPRLVKPLPPDYALPTDNYIEPTRSDVILRGRLEGSRPDIATSMEEAPANSSSAPAAPTAPAAGGFEPK